MGDYKKKLMLFSDLQLKDDKKGTVYNSLHSSSANKWTHLIVNSKTTKNHIHYHLSDYLVLIPNVCYLLCNFYTLTQFQ